MHNDRQLTIGLDFDDVLAPCVSLVLDNVNKKLGTHYALEDVHEWKFESFPEHVRNEIYAEFGRPEFYASQTLYPGAKELIKELQERSKKTVIVTAAWPIAMSTRGAFIERELPGVPYYITKDKDLVSVDLLLDDALHNLSATKAKYPIIMDRPWNRSGRGKRVTTYEEFLETVDAISNGATLPDLMRKPTSKWGVDSKLLICLIGPSGSGKTAICDRLVDSPVFGRPVTTTTRSPRPGEIDGVNYNFVSRESFIEGLKQGRFYEYTEYAGNYYGTDKAMRSIEKIWESGKHALIPIDIIGAQRMKEIYGNKCVMVFVFRKESEVIRSIIDRQIPEEEKISRIETIGVEFANEILCDMTIDNNGTIDEAVEKLMRVVGL